MQNHHFNCMLRCYVQVRLFTNHVWCVFVHSLSFLVVLALSFALTYSHFTVMVPAILLTVHTQKRISRKKKKEKDGNAKKEKNKIALITIIDVFTVIVLISLGSCERAHICRGTRDPKPQIQMIAMAKWNEVVCSPFQYGAPKPIQNTKRVWFFSLVLRKLTHIQIHFFLAGSRFPHSLFFSLSLSCFLSSTHSLFVYGMREKKCCENNKPIKNALDISVANIK